MTRPLRRTRWVAAPAIVGAIAMTVAFVLLLADAPGAAQDQPPPGRPTFTTRAEGVRIDVLVTDDRGRPVPNLTAADFTLSDSGVAQQVSVLPMAALPLDVILVLDTSTSLRAQGLADLIKAARATLEGLRPDDRVALVTFSQRVRIRSMLTTRVAVVRAEIEALALAGATSIIDGVYAGLAVQGIEHDRPALLLAFSDGIDTDSWLRAPAVLEIARRTPVVPHAVVVGSGVAAQVRWERSNRWRGPVDPLRREIDDAERFLSDLVDVGGGVIVDAQTTGNLEKQFADVLTNFRQRYVLTYAPRGVERRGWHPLEIDVKGRGRQVRARPGYFVP